MGTVRSGVDVLMLSLYWLEPGDPFPSTEAALEQPPGLLAAGGSLDTPTLVAAYKRGIFPWFSPEEPPLWWTPDPRLVFFPERFHCARRLRRRFRNAGWTVSLAQAFPEVIRACAEPRPDQPGTWISPAMIEAYEGLFHDGYGHSVEIWRDDQLIGGLYGLQLGRVFFGESMFSREPDASKAALFTLSALRGELGIRLLDAQVDSGHLRSLGAELIARTQFEDYLDRWVHEPSAHPGARAARALAELTG